MTPCILLDTSQAWSNSSSSSSSSVLYFQWLTDGSSHHMQVFFNCSSIVFPCDPQLEILHSFVTEFWLRPRRWSCQSSSYSRRHEGLMYLKSICSLLYWFLYILFLYGFISVHLHECLIMISEDCEEQLLYLIWPTVVESERHSDGRGCVRLACCDCQEWCFWSMMDMGRINAAVVSNQV